MTTIRTNGLRIETSWSGGLPATRMVPADAGDLYIDAIQVDDIEDAAELFERLGVPVDLAATYYDLILPDQGETARVYEWAREECEEVWA